MKIKKLSIENEDMNNEQHKYCIKLSRFTPACEDIGFRNHKF